ncbi:MAG: sugar ABC transporter permease, partial [Ruthenibacterium sp.]
MKNILENKKYIFWLCAPATVLFGMFVLYPLINIFILSFQNSNGLMPATFAGLGNYMKIFTDASFNRANIASIGLCFLAIVFDAFLAIFVAILLSALHPLVQKLIRTAYLIPLVLSISVISQLWLTIYHAEWGLLNSFLRALGLEKLTHAWLIDEHTAMICIAIVGMWWMFGMFVLLASSGIRAIPESCFEAARIDGA